MESNIALQKKVLNLSYLLTIMSRIAAEHILTNIPCEEKATSEEVLKKKKKLINEEAEVEILEETITRVHEETIDRVHRVDPKKNKNQAVVKFFTFRRQKLFYRARKKLKNGIRLHIDLTRKRFNLLLDAQSFIKVKKMLKMSMPISIAI